MRTKRITIIYQIGKEGIIPLDRKAVIRRDEWMRQARREVEADWKPLMLKVDYRIYNPEIDAIRDFFNGPVVEYWKIQSADMLDRRPTHAEIKEARETILSNALGYEVQLIGRTERRRKSTADWMGTQQWVDFLEELRETEFEPNGYEMPNSEEYWELAESMGSEKAREHQIHKLQTKIRAKLAGDNRAG